MDLVFLELPVKMMILIPLIMVWKMILQQNSGQIALKLFKLIGLLVMTNH